MSLAAGLLLSALGAVVNSLGALGLVRGGGTLRAASLLVCALGIVASQSAVLLAPFSVVLPVHSLASVVQLFTQHNHVTHGVLLSVSVALCCAAGPRTHLLDPVENLRSLSGYPGFVSAQLFLISAAFVMHLAYQQLKIQIMHEVSAEYFHPEMATSVQTKALAMLSAARNMTAAVQSHLSSAAIVMTVGSIVQHLIVYVDERSERSGKSDSDIDARVAQLALLGALNLCATLYVYSSLRASTLRLTSEQQRLLYTHHALGTVLAMPIGGLLFYELQALPRNRLLCYAAGVTLMAGTIFEICAQCPCIVPMTVPELLVLAQHARESAEALLSRTTPARSPSAPYLRAESAEDGGVDRNYALLADGVDYLGHDLDTTGAKSNNTHDGTDVVKRNGMQAAAPGRTFASPSQITSRAFASPVASTGAFART